MPADSKIATAMRISASIPKMAGGNTRDGTAEMGNAGTNYRCRWLRRIGQRNRQMSNGAGEESRTLRIAPYDWIFFAGDCR